MQWLGKLKAKVYQRGDLETKDESNLWSTPASSRLPKWFIAHVIKNYAQTCQFDFIKDFIQSDIKMGMFVTLDKE